MAVQAQTPPAPVRLTSTSLRPVETAGGAASSLRTRDTHPPPASFIPSARWLLLLPAAGALVAGAAALWRRRVRPAALTPVSDEWLRTHGVRAGRQWEP